MASGWQGLFAIEKNQDAFQTLSHNLIEGEKYKFCWPTWLPIKPMSVSTLIKRYYKNLIELRGQVDLVAGGPPCQGFSTAGRRDPDDKRNKLTEHYIKVVDLVRPKYVLLENVAGFTMAFNSAANKGRLSKNKQPYSEVVQSKLEALGYTVFTSFVLSSRIGVPQSRERFIMLAIYQGEEVLTALANKSPFDILEEIIPQFRSRKGLPIEGNVCVQDAISDLQAEGSMLIDCIDTRRKGFRQIQYAPPPILSPYLKLMRESCNGDSPNSLRLANHRPKTIDKFKRIHQAATPGGAVSQEVKQRLGIRKHSLTVLAPNRPSATITTVPEDVLHYKEYRILTVRENARLQSFPDWFDFQGQYTTGGKARKKDCPRYTQVANAVPPLLAEILGVLLLMLATFALRASAI
jgi:DNA (cytosine-5)-methyltransferase 1